MRDATRRKLILSPDAGFVRSLADKPCEHITDTSRRSRRTVVDQCNRARGTLTDKCGLTITIEDQQMFSSFGKNALFYAIGTTGLRTASFEVFAMRSFVGLLCVGVSLWLAAACGARQPQPEYRTAATIKDIMDSMVDPSGDFMFDSVAEIADRVVMKRDLEIAALKEKLKLLGESALDEVVARKGLARIDQTLRDRLRQVEGDREFLRHANVGGEAMAPEERERVNRIGTEYKWIDASGGTADFLTDDEIKNLTISRGTLTDEEREKINHHIVATIKMLEALPWPKHLSHVPEYAGGHHERMDGKGYPRGLKREEMSVQARVMGIADIFEALTAKDRPYKRGKTLSESLKILGNFRLNGHIDPDLFDIFVRKKIYLRYAEQFLDPDQIDEVDERKIPGFAA